MLSGRLLSRWVWTGTHSTDPGGAPVLAFLWWSTERLWILSLCTRLAGTSLFMIETRKRGKGPCIVLKLHQACRERKSMSKVRGFLVSGIKVTKVDRRRNHRTQWCLAGWVTPRMVLKWMSLHTHPTLWKNLAEMLQFLFCLPPLSPQPQMMKNHLPSIKTRDWM